MSIQTRFTFFFHADPQTNHKGPGCCLWVSKIGPHMGPHWSGHRLFSPFFFRLAWVGRKITISGVTSDNPGIPGPLLDDHLVTMAMGAI